MVSPPEIVRKLQNRIRRLEGSCRRADQEVVSSGCVALDRILPCGGVNRSSLVEWIGDGPGSGAGTLALLGARQACSDGGALVVVDGKGCVYPPAIAAWGMDLEKVIFVFPKDERDLFWAWDQALRCPGVAAVWGGVDRIDPRRFRRLQLSAEASGAVGLLVRPVEMLGQPTWAELRLLDRPRPSKQGRRVQGELRRSHGGGRGGCILVELEEWTG